MREGRGTRRRQEKKIGERKRKEVAEERKREKKKGGREGGGKEGREGRREKEPLVKEAKHNNGTRKSGRMQERGQRIMGLSRGNLSGRCSGIRRLHRTVAAKISVQSVDF